MEKKLILVVDDEKNIRLTMSQSLEPLEIPIRTALNGEEALQMLGEETFELIFLDLKLPGIDGMEVLHQVRNNWPKTRVIIITAHGTIDSAVEAMKLGAVDFIQKPFSPSEIRDLAKLVLEREALDIDPSFKPARMNLDRTTSWNKFGKIDLGSDNGDTNTKDAKSNGGRDET